jgi:hypothetical protein
VTTLAPRGLVEFRVVSEYAAFVVGQAPFRSQIGGDVRTFRHGVVERGEQGVVLAEMLRRTRKRVVQAVDQLEHRQVDVGQLVAHQMRVALIVLRDHALEVAHEFRYPVVDEIMGANLGGVHLVLVVEVRGKRVMSVMDFGHHIGDRQLQPVRDVAQVFVGGREAELRAEVEQDVGGLRYEQIAVAQERRCEWRAGFALAFHDGQHCTRSLTLRFVAARHFDVVRARFFECEPHEFPATLQTVPIVEFKAHRSILCWLISLIPADSDCLHGQYAAHARRVVRRNAQSPAHGRAGCKRRTRVGINRTDAARPR